MKPEPEVPDAVTLKSIKDLVFEHGDNNFGTAFPFWYIAVKGGGILRRPVMISEGIWFSYEAAEDHLKAKSHRYPKTAFVWCDSAHNSWAGLRKLMEMLKSVPDAPVMERGTWEYDLSKAVSYKVYLVASYSDLGEPFVSVSFKTDTGGWIPLGSMTTAGNAVYAFAPLPEPPPGEEVEE